MKKLLTGLGIIGLCGLCCALPFLLIGGAGVIGASILPWQFGLIALLSTVVIMLLIRRSKSNNTSCTTDGSCGCKPGAH